jgi:hypothetical protein
MTSQLDQEQLLACLDAALVEADRIGHTLAAAMIAECITAVEMASLPPSGA